MNHLPNIKIVSASDSESESSSSVEEADLKGEPTEIEKIDSINKELKNKITYQIMQYKATTRQALSEIPAPAPKSNEDPSLVSLDSSESKLQNVQDFLSIISEFQSSQKELAVTRDSISKIEEESQQLYEKLKNLEDTFEKRNQKLADRSNCRCEIV